MKPSASPTSHVPPPVRGDWIRVTPSASTCRPVVGFWDGMLAPLLRASLCYGAAVTRAIHGERRASMNPAPMRPAMHLSDEPSAPRFQVHAWRLPARLFALLALTVCGANILFLSVLSVAEIILSEMLLPLNLVPRWVAVYSLLPLALVGALRWLTAATVLVKPDQLVLVGRRARYEIPLGSVERIRPWWLPLPGPGLTLRMKSGRHFRYGLQVSDPTPLLEALGQREALGERGAEHLFVRFARARHEFLRRRWYHLAFKYALFSLVPTVILFRLHQYITFGGPFGEYQMHGLGRYLKSFFAQWSNTAAYLFLYAGCWRAVAELLALGATRLLPRRARGVRRFTEMTLRVVYYAGLPGLIGVRLLLM